MNTLSQTPIDLKKAKERSPSFPFITLSYAIERARQFFAEEKRGSAFLPIAARHWGYSPNSSGALQTVAALKSYGLMSDEGSGDQRKLRLTETALRIILDERPDSTERKEYIRQAALTPSIAAEVRKHWPSSLPSPASLIHWLVLEKKFSQESALKASKIIKENQEFANISDEGVESSGDKIEPDNDFQKEPEVLEILDGSGRPSSANLSGIENRVMERLRIAGALLGHEKVAAIATPANEPMGKQVGSSIPVTKNCSMSIIADGEVTQEGLDKLVAYIQLIKGSFPEKEEQQQ